MVTVIILFRSKLNDWSKAKFKKLNKVVHHIINLCKLHLPALLLYKHLKCQSFLWHGHKR